MFQRILNTTYRNKTMMSFGFIISIITYYMCCKISDYLIITLGSNNATLNVTSLWKY